MNTDPLAHLLNAERAVQPPTEIAERGLGRLLGDLSAHVAPLPIATGSLQLGLSLVPKWLVVGFAVGLGGAGAAAQLSPPASATTRAPAAVLAPGPELAQPAPVATGPAAIASESAPSGPLAREPEAPRPALTEPSNSPTFDAELRLITLAKGELERGRPHLAQAWLDEHAQRFSGGVFAVEREALRILGSCAARRQPGLVSAFAARYPGSALLERLHSACSNQPATKPPATHASAVDFPKSTNGFE